MVKIAVLSFLLPITLFSAQPDTFDICLRETIRSDSVTIELRFWKRLDAQVAYGGGVRTVSQVVRFQPDTATVTMWANEPFLRGKYAGWQELMHGQLFASKKHWRIDYGGLVEEAKKLLRSVKVDVNLDRPPPEVEY